MKKFIIVVMFLPMVVYGQTTIPIPSGIGSNSYITFSHAIGDFDGDVSDDVSVWYRDSITNTNHFSIYSFKKNTHLLVIEGDGFHSGGDTPIDKYVHDLDNDGTVEIIIDDKIYSFTNVGIKKKLP